MSVRRLSISVPEDVEEAIRAAAETAGVPVSTWLADAATRAAAEQAAIADGLVAVAEYEAEYGPLSTEGRDRARQVLIDAGIIAPPTQRTG
jgi:hypothetical protein